MKKLNALIKKYKNRPDRWESDCNVLGEICFLVSTTISKKERKSGLKWLFHVLADKKTIELAREKVRLFLERCRDGLSTKRQKKLDKINKKHAARTKKNMLV